MNRVLALFALVSISTAGCQRVPDVSGALDQYASVLNREITLTCECPDELRYSGFQECFDDFNSVSLDDQDCLEDAATGSEKEVAEYFDCALPALESYLECLQDRAETCEEGLYDDCLRDRTDLLRECPRLPSRVEADFWACLE